MIRNVKLVTEQYYHIFNKSIEKFRIFNHEGDYSRMMLLMQYYQPVQMCPRFSEFARLEKSKEVDIKERVKEAVTGKESQVEIIAYCLMPTHFHFLLKQVKDCGIMNFMRVVQNSYSSYFNTRHKRQGPLWSGRFKAVLVENDAQLMHLTRYIHLNPATAGLVRKPQDWQFSSYREYIHGANSGRQIINRSFCPDPFLYKKFVEDREDYQRELHALKGLTLEEHI